MYAVYYFFFSLSYLVRHSFARLPLLGGFRLYPGLHTHIKVIYISVIVPSMLFEVVWVLEVTNAHTFRIVSLIRLCTLGAANVKNSLSFSLE